MRVVFMGTPEFAVPSLRALAEKHDLLAVYTRPDRPRGRGRDPVPSPVKAAAEDLGVPVRQPVSLRDPGEGAALAAIGPEVVCVAAYGLILPKEVLGLPPFGCLNVHASLLPRWRGAAPVQRAILAGDEETGVSIMRMEEGLDTGDYTEQRRLPVDDLTAADLTAALAGIGAEALLAVLDGLPSGTIRWTAQDPDAVTHADKVRAEDVSLAPELGVEDGLRRVRASTPSAPCRARVGDARVTVLRAARHPDAVPAGSVLAGKSFLAVGMADGALSLQSVKPEGRGEMTGADWARGARFSADVRWGPW